MTFPMAKEEFLQKKPGDRFEWGGKTHEVVSVYRDGLADRLTETEWGISREIGAVPNGGGVMP